LRCLKCRSEAVAKRRRRLKQILVDEAGGRCQICGYDRHVGALEFHHVDPRTKAFSLANAGVTRSIERARAEVQKCVLLCGNCHAEVQAGFTKLPVKLIAAAVPK
jgi:5-methylcytosine-specific restriction endonuclease McrA